MGTATQERLIPDTFTAPIEPAKLCAFCDEDRSVYQLGDKWICIDHIAFVVSLAANDVWPHAVSYTREFEDYLLW